MGYSEVEVDWTIWLFHPIVGVQKVKAQSEMYRWTQNLRRDPKPIIIQSK